MKFGGKILDLGMAKGLQAPHIAQPLVGATSGLEGHTQIGNGPEITRAYLLHRTHTTGWAQVHTPDVNPLQD